jgi:phospholipase C
MSNPVFPLIDHVFVLMLENHSFDNLLGFSGITGTDAETGNATAINGLTGSESNSSMGIPYNVKAGAAYSMPADPGHEFPDVFIQLTGNGTPYDPKTGYSPINNSGFADDYINGPKGQGQDIMNCFKPEQLPVLNALAQEFAVCDSWFSSLPGPTCPNRFFVHAGTSGGLDHSPGTAQIVDWETLNGIKFENGTVFDQLKIMYDDGFQIYRGEGFPTDIFPNVAQLKGITSVQAKPFSDFQADVTDPAYPYAYTFIEPSYGNVLGGTYEGGSSMHPMDDATRGELLIKETYEAIRNSPIWPKSLLIVIWDEHGGFYDHVAPPAAVAPGDAPVSGTINQYQFDFTQYGVRVPAVIVSPLIPKGTIDHRLYDHSSVPRTLQDLFSIKPMTERDKNANSLLPLLLTLSTPRTDARTTLPAPADSGIVVVAAVSAANMLQPADQGSLPLFLHAALKTDLETSLKSARPAIEQQFQNIKTKADAQAYLEKVQNKIS